MSRIVIGKAGNRNITLDLNILLRTRLLVQANSGGGKSWLLRRLAEQLFGKVQVIIIDPEGEFATLREKLDFVLVGPGGETPADVRSAEMVARRLLELRISAICDLYEMKESERHTWLRLFLNALINAPKKLWHPMVLILDEASDFCPEGKAGGSEAAQAVMAFSRKGRKRGFCPIMATQSLATLDKKTSRHLHNRLIGPTFEDVDIERSIDLLSIAARDKKEFAHDIRTMEPGCFYAFGRAISKVRVLLEVGPVSTTHPDIGRSKIALKPPPPPSKIRALLPKLADLPKEAEQEAQTVADFRKEIRLLKAQLRAAPQVVKAVADPRPIQKAVALETKKNAVLRAVLEEAMKMIVKVNAIGFEDTAIKPEEVKEMLQATAKAIAKLSGDKITRWAKEFDLLKKQTNRLLARMKTMLSQEEVSVKIDVKRTKPFLIQTSPTRAPRTAEFESDSEELTPARKKLLAALAQFDALGQQELPRTWVAAVAGVSHRSSAFDNNLGRLRGLGLIDYGPGKTIHFTEQGRSATPPVDAPLSNDEMLASCLRILKPAQAKLLQVLHEVHPEFVSRDDLAEQAGVSRTSSAFDNNLGAMRSAGMIEYGPDKTAKCSDWLFID